MSYLSTSIDYLMISLRILLTLRAWWLSICLNNVICWRMRISFFLNYRLFSFFDSFSCLNSLDMIPCNFLGLINDDSHLVFGKLEYLGHGMSNNKGWSYCMKESQRDNECQDKFSHFKFFIEIDNFHDLNIMP